MMLYPPMADLVEKIGSRYLLVNLVSRRAREIATQVNEDAFERKPVSQAIDEVYTGKLTISDLPDFSESVESHRYPRTF